MGGFWGLESLRIELVFIFFWSCQSILMVGLGANRESAGYFELFCSGSKMREGIEWAR